MGWQDVSSPGLVEVELEWSPRFSVAVQQIDDEHKVMIGLINKAREIAELMEADAEVDKLLDEMHAYAVMHFSTEGALMEQYGYPQCREHDRVHQVFLDRIREAKKRRRGQRTDPYKIFQFLGDWFQKHILGDDKSLGAFLNSKGVF